MYFRFSSFSSTALYKPCWLSPGFVASPILLFLCVEMLFAIYFNRLILHSIREKKNAKIVAYTKLLLYSVSVSAIPFCFHLLELLYLVSFIWISQFTYTHTYIPLRIHTTCMYIGFVCRNPNPSFANIYSKEDERVYTVIKN